MTHEVRSIVLSQTPKFSCVDGCNLCTYHTIA